MSSFIDRIAVTAGALSTDPRQSPVLARQLGFGGLLFDAFSPTLDLTSLSTTGRREFRHMIASAGIRLVGLRADLGPKGFGLAADVDLLLSKLDAVLESAVGLGADVTCIDLGPLPAPAVVAKPKPKVNADLAGLIIVPTLAPDPEPVRESPPPDPTLVSQIDTAMFELGRRADRYNASIAFSSSLAGFAAVERALLAARCPWFGVDLDPIAMLKDQWPVAEIMTRLGNLIRHVRGRDAVAGAEARTKPAVIARGDVKWRELLNALSGATYHGWITVDPLELQDRRGAAIAGLKQLLAYAE